MRIDRRTLGLYQTGLQYIMVTGCAVVLGSSSAANAAVTAPVAGQHLESMQTFTITWDPRAGCPSDEVDILLYQGRSEVCPIALGAPNNGSYTWTVDACGSEPACDLSVHVVCGSERDVSGVFGIDAQIILELESASRSVSLRWQRTEDDTLGAERIEPLGGRVFGGYNVWRKTYDNRQDDALRERFVKVRNYSITSFGSDTLATAWDFPRPERSIGSVIDSTDVNAPPELWSLAQTFTVPAGSPDEDVCGARVFLGEVFSRWNTTLSITRLANGVPDTSQALVSIEASFGTGGAFSGFAWQPYEFETPVTLTAGTSYALLLTGATAIQQDGTKAGWVYTTYDAFPDGAAWFSKDGGGSWEEAPMDDYGFLLRSLDTGVCTDADWSKQLRGGSLLREFNDPGSIKAFVRDEDGVLLPLEPTGPFNGFQLEYAVTSFDRAQAASGNIERPSACEDTLFEASGFPLGVQPNAMSIWPETVFPESQQPSSSPLLAQVYPVPNPYVRDVTSVSFPRWELPGERKIQFVNMPQGALIRIFTIAADLIRTLRHEGDTGTIDWDLQNESGELVAAGIYIWLVTLESGERKTGQLVIVL